MNSVPRIGVGALLVLGTLLVTHPLWIFVLEPLVYGNAWYGWVVMMGWVYLLVAGLGAAVVLPEKRTLTLWQLLGVTVLTFPIIVVVFQSGVGQRPHSLDLDYAVRYTFLMFPAAIAYPTGVAARRSRSRQLGVGLLVWVVAWTAYVGDFVGLILGFDIFAIVMTMYNLFAVLLFSIPVFAVGVLSAREPVDGSAERTT